jgi:quinoprotein glucose dehydrogenase
VYGEKTWPTQPFPTKPAPYEIQGVHEDDLIDFTPELRAEALELLKQYNHGPLYTPPTTGKPTINMPGWAGGGNWYGCSVDPETGIVYIPSNRDAIAVTLAAPDPARSNFNYVGRMTMNIAGPKGLPIWKPPYTHLSAIDLNTGETLWNVPIGDGPRDHELLKDLNLPKLGDFGRPFIMSTKTLLFVAHGSSAKLLFAFDKATGEELCRIELPSQPQGAPMSYFAGGKQFITIPVGGRREGNGLIALALP